MKIVDNDFLEKLSSQAKASNRLRKNYNFHESMDDPIQRLLNAFEPNSYVQPHRHLNPDKREVFVVLCGRLLIVTFNDSGLIKEHVILDRSKGIYMVEIGVGEWHMVVGLEEGTVVYEIKDGPYSVMDDKDFASWAPSEKDSDALKYLNQILGQLNL